MFLSSPFRYAVEVGGDTLHWVAVNGKTLNCYLWSAPLFPDRSGRDDKQSPEGLRKALEKSLQECKNSVPKWSKSVQSTVEAGCLGGYLEMPHLSDQELEVAVPGAVCRHIPWGLEEVYLTIIKVPPLSANKERRGICYVVIPKAVVNEHKELLESVGLKPTEIELLPLALRREFLRNHPSCKNCVGLIHMTDRSTHVLFLKGPNPYYYRNFSTGRADFIYAVQMDGQLSWGDARSRLEQVDLEQGEVGVEPVLLRWLGEIGRCLRGLSSLAAAPPLVPTKLYLSGDKLPPGLSSRLQAETQLESCLDDWEKLQPDDSFAGSNSAPYKVALGLALADQ